MSKKADRLRKVAKFLNSKEMRDQRLPLTIKQWGKFIVGKTIGCRWYCEPKFPEIVIQGYIMETNADYEFLTAGGIASTAGELAGRLLGLARRLEQR